MFQESLIESTSLLRSGNRWPTFAAVTLQALLVLLLLLSSLLHPEFLPSPLASVILRAPSPPTPKPPPPPHVLPRLATLANTATPTQLASFVPATPTRALISLQASVVNLGDRPVLASVQGLIADAGLPTALSNAPPASPHVVRATSTPTNISPARVSSGVSAGLLLAPIYPLYPPIARAAHVEGIVVIEAVISRTGTIESAHILSGSPMLANAALTAVREARYRPYQLNGEPTEVQTTISVHFRLGN